MIDSIMCFCLCYHSLAQLSGGAGGGHGGNVIQVTEEEKNQIDNVSR